MLEMTDVPAAGSKDLDESKSGASDVVVSGAILLGVSDENAAADVLNIKGRKALAVAIAIAVVMVVPVVAVAIAVQVERIIAEVHAFESRVVDFHSSGSEIGDVK